MTGYEESIAFYHELGVAVSAWANVERALVWIVTSCFSEQDQESSALMFLSIENFRSKTQVADNLFRTKFDGTAHIESWNELSQRTERLSQLRNHLVHYHTMGYSDGKPGRRLALIPTLSRKPKFRQKLPKPPSGSLCLRDIVSARLQFTALAFGLEFLVHRVNQQKTLLPASLAQADDAPSMAKLTHQIRTMLSQPLSP